MKIELITIGNEVLSGHTVNTNASFIAEKLFHEGYKLGLETTIPDIPEEIAHHINESLNRSDFVITTGGLGPTLDDISGKVAEETLETAPELIENNLGSAPGLIFQRRNHTLVMLPGVPYEMKAMFLKNVLPYLKKHFAISHKRIRKILNFTAIVEVKVDPALRELKTQYPDLDFGIYPALGLLHVHIYGPSEEAIDPALDELKRRFADYVFESNVGTIEDAVQTLFVKNGWTLSCAESCTGGSVASQLTKIPGASGYFLGSVVSYANEAKMGILGVSKKTLEEHGAVSREVVTEMVLGVNRLFKSEFSVAITGVAGPAGGSDVKPVGTVWFAVCRRGQDPKSWKVQGWGTREMIIHYCVNEILGKLYHEAKNQD